MPSGGRLRLGIGVDWNAVELGALDETFENRGRRSAEQTAVLRALTDAAPVHLSGVYRRDFPHPARGLALWPVSVALCACV